MAVFLDVGAHIGQTVDEVIHQRYGFRHIYAYEPMPDQFAELSAVYGDCPQVTLCRYGLAAEAGTRVLFGSNAGLEASFFEGKLDVDAGVWTPCAFAAAGLELVEIANRWPGEPLIAKLNCEGAEVEIVNAWLDTYTIGLLAHVLIDWDIRKVPRYEHLEAETIKRMADVGFDRWVDAHKVMHGPTHQQRIAAWLDTVSGIWQ